jgi:DME family drug/metabolite transporter
LLFSTGGAAIKAVQLSGWQVASARSGVAAMVILLAFPEGRRWSWRMVPVAVAYAATLVLFVLANRLTTAANAIFLQSGAPLYLLFLGPLLLREPVRRKDLAFMAAVALGVGVLLLGREPGSALATNPPLGNLLAAASGLTYALLIAGLRWLGRGRETNPGIPTVALGSLLACFATLPWALPFPNPTPGDIAVVLYLGSVQVGLAYILLASGIRQVPAVEATTLLLIEPALNPLWTWIVHGERPHRWSLLGGSIILLATMSHTWRQRATNGSKPFHNHAATQNVIKRKKADV